MSARKPLLAKTPFVLDARPLSEASSPHAGLLATSRAFRSLGLPELIEANLALRKRQRGFSEAQMIESLLLLQTVGGESPEDIRLLSDDPCVERGLGYAPPKVTALREFLDRFHDERLEALRPARELQKSFILPGSEPVHALQQVITGCVRRIQRLYEAHRQPMRVATVDMDATIIESHKATARPHYEGGRGYQPILALWSEADLILADEFRDGNVPARQAPLTCAQRAFAALPAGITQRAFRGDSACHESDLIGWLSDPKRDREAGGRIGFAISAATSEGLAKAWSRVPERSWQTFGHDSDGTLRQWAELDYVPSERYENKDSKPLRYVGLRLLKPQGLLFADGSDRKHFAIITNRTESGDRLIEWHRQKAGTIEHVHDELKNGLGGGHMPSQHFNVNAAWLKIAILAYNVASAIKGLCFSPEERTVRFKKYRLLLVHLAGRMNRNNCVMGLRLCASAEAIKRMLNVWEIFALTTQATSTRALGRASP
jgi:hypothetical protein